MSEEPDDTLIGQVLSGRFEIVEPIGVGGMGRVYKAIQHPLDRVVALKVLNPRYDGKKDPGFEKRFFLEASMTARLKHPNTITVHDYGRTEDGVYYLAMEYLEGQNLQQLVGREGPISWQRALFIGAQVARSLREAHKLGLVHRDLKPANIMLISEGGVGDLVKVLDFGLVKNFQVEPQRIPGQQKAEITQSGVLLGSPMYMAPEQARNQVDPRTDIYSLGVVLFQAMCGRTPFLGTESIDLIVQHIKERPPELASLAQVPPDVNSLIMKCLEKSPAARFQSMDQLLDAMHAASTGQGISGIFKDPRLSSSSSGARGAPGSSPSGLRGSPSGPSSGVQATPGGLRLPPAGKSGPASAPVELRLKDGGRWPTSTLVAAAAVVVAGAVAGGVLAYRTGEPAEAPRPAAEPPAVARPRAAPEVPAAVVFEVKSEPTGATVLAGGAVLGVTPFSFTQPRDGAGPARAELTFRLDGYQEASVPVQGSEGPVPVFQQLRPRVAAAPPPPVPAPAPAPAPTPARPAPKAKKPARAADAPTGFKEDPYQ